MKLTTEEVLGIAHLARLDIAADAVPGYRDNLSRILDFVAQLEQVTADIEPMARPEELAQRLRDDRVEGTIDRERYQQDAAATEGGLYLVPKVIE